MSPALSPRQLARHLEEKAVEAHVRTEIVEKDFVLSYVLAGLRNHPKLGGTLIFKGGTALRKCLIEGYRFSEDLDFTALELVQDKRVDRWIAEAVRGAQSALDAWGTFKSSLRKVVNPHTMGLTEGYTVEMTLPWRSEPCRIKLEICYDEPVVCEPVARALIHPYADGLESDILCYDLHEVVAEKLRCILQTCRKLDHGTLTTSRARDYYDLWNLLKGHWKVLDTDEVNRVLGIKAAVRKVTWRTWEDFMRPDLLGLVESRWQNEVVDFVGRRVDFSQVKADLRALLPDLVRYNAVDYSVDVRQVQDGDATDALNAELEALFSARAEEGEAQER
jgi:predicted nucleotidyltransferase component of viral defense system